MEFYAPASALFGSKVGFISSFDKGLQVSQPVGPTQLSPVMGQPRVSRPTIRSHNALKGFGQDLLGNISAPLEPNESPRGKRRDKRPTAIE